MTNKQLIRETVKALALGDGVRARELNKQMLDEDREDYVIYVAAFFAGAAGHIFNEDQSHEAIRQFVDKMAYAYRNAETPFKPLAMEALIRVLLGEEHLLDEVTPEDQFNLQILAIRMIVDQTPEIQAQLDDYLTDAETLAAEWQSED